MAGHWPKSRSSQLATWTSDRATTARTRTAAVSPAPADACANRSLPDPDAKMHGPVVFEWIEQGAALAMRMGDAATWIFGRDDSKPGMRHLRPGSRARHAAVPLLRLPARLVVPPCARALKISQTGPWKEAFLACREWLCALHAPV